MCAIRGSPAPEAESFEAAVWRAGASRAGRAGCSGWRDGNWREPAFRPLGAPGMHVPSTSGGPGDAGCPAWFGVCPCEQLPVVRREARIPRPPRSFGQRPRTRRSFHTSAVGSAAGVQVCSVRSQVLETSPSAWPDPWRHARDRHSPEAETSPCPVSGPGTLHARSHRPRAVEHRDCPPCGGDGGSIAQVRGCRITFLETSRTAPLSPD